MTASWSSVIETPLGPFEIRGDAEGVRAATFDPASPDPDRPAAPAGVIAAFTAWFAGDLSALEPVPMAPDGTAFQRTVWTALRTIPAGTTLTYADLAARIGRPKAVRAVGRANATNPIAVAIPCHRVVTRSGTLGGYAGGLEKKRWLLAHEGAPGYLVP